MEGGIYIVTLNNEEMISTQAHDRRFDDKNPLKVNKQNIKFGKAEDFNGRKLRGYNRTFGKSNVNFIPVVAVKIDNLKKTEDEIKLRLCKWRVRSPSKILTEWTSGISEREIIDEIRTAIDKIGVEHKLLK